MRRKTLAIGLSILSAPLVLFAMIILARAASDGQFDDCSFDDEEGAVKAAERRLSYSDDPKIKGRSFDARVETLWLPANEDNRAVVWLVASDEPSIVIRMHVTEDCFRNSYSFE